MRGRGARALPSTRNKLALALVADARWRALTPSGRLALVVAANAYATDDLSFDREHGEWAALARIGITALEEALLDATGCELISRSRKRRRDGMLGGYTYRFDAVLLAPESGGGARPGIRASSGGPESGGQRRRKKNNALTESTSVGSTTTAHGSSKLETVEGEATSRASTNGSVPREANCPGCLRMTGSRLIDGARVCAGCDSEEWGR